MSRNTSHRNYGSALCFLQIKSSTQRLSRIRARDMERNIYFLFPSLESFVRFADNHALAGAGARLYLFIDCYSHDKMPTRGRSMKWSYAVPRHGSSYNGKIKLNASDAESKNHKAHRGARNGKNNFAEILSKNLAININLKINFIRLSR